MASSMQQAFEVIFDDLIMVNPRPEGPEDRIVFEDPGFVEATKQEILRLSKGEDHAVTTAKQWSKGHPHCLWQCRCEVDPEGVEVFIISTCNTPKEWR